MLPLMMDRLTISDLKEQKGGFLATIFILSIILISATTQTIKSLEGQFIQKYFKFALYNLVDFISSYQALKFITTY